MGKKSRITIALVVIILWALIAGAFMGGFSLFQQESNISENTDIDIDGMQQKLEQLQDELEKSQAKKTELEKKLAVKFYGKLATLDSRPESITLENQTRRLLVLTYLDLLNKKRSPVFHFIKKRDISLEGYFCERYLVLVKKIKGDIVSAWTFIPNGVASPSPRLLREKNAEIWSITKEVSFNGSEMHATLFQSAISTIYNYEADIMSIRSWQNDEQAGQSHLSTAMTILSEFIASYRRGPRPEIPSDIETEDETHGPAQE